MKHTYLSTLAIDDALLHHCITSKEARKLKKKINCQADIYKIIHK